MYNPSNFDRRIQVETVMTPEAVKVPRSGGGSR
jgi:hypothetical protein